MQLKLAIVLLPDTCPHVWCLKLKPTIKTFVPSPVSFTDVIVRPEILVYYLIWNSKKVVFVVTS